MRSYDKRMLEEINRIVCDHCSDFLFVYHENYKIKSLKENIDEKSIFVVGNTIVEVVKDFIPNELKLNNQIILDIHRPENFKCKNRLENIIKYSNLVSENYNIPIYMLGFKRTLNYLSEFGIELGKIQVIDLQPFKNYLKLVYHSKFIISDSGTAQEEPALLDTPVIVPRDFTERPESIENNCSFMLDVNTLNNITWNESIDWLENNYKFKDINWLGNGKTSEYIINIIKEKI
jgi:UDP-N-acetylglucosamine 2-epimerase (non-hydrolysing)